MAQKVNVKNVLKNIALFSKLDDHALDILVEGTRRMQCKKGDVLFSSGERCEGLHTVVYGLVKLSILSVPGVEKVVRIVHPPQNVGKPFLFSDMPYSVTATVLEDTLIFFTSKEAIFEVMYDNPVFVNQMLHGLSNWIYSLMYDIESYSLHSAAQRVIGFLLKDKEMGNGDVITLSTNKSVIASRLNITPEHFSRLLQELSHDGLIEVKGRNIRINDVERLKNY
ncbi:Crp/Fnr family transcriptional regulator [Brackiella oedipodis]|uniref:Crp/Fnr family transcriptional regulator n=1 Tax=Brackiella oedipodis TaxID=124225 RepID=UPI000491EF81|nr:Crp/Fnr family transcriptional regulator [Brackiella oedipodis]